jgi:hypothetical protein
MSHHKHTDTGASQPSSELQQLRCRVAYLEASLAKAGEDRARFERLFANACETLGAIQEALGNENTPELTGFEPELVKKLRDEKDALAAHIDSFRRLRDSAAGLTWDDVEEWMAADPGASLARRDAETQAEAIEQIGCELYDAVGLPANALQFIQDKADEKRRQAQELRS